MVGLNRHFYTYLTDRSWVTIREALVRRLADLGLLTAQEVNDVLPDLTVAEPWVGSGESLMVSSSELACAVRLMR